jgi:hypothetical protein
LTVGAITTHRDGMTCGDLYPRIVADAPNAWKEAPVILETCETMSFWSRRITLGDKPSSGPSTTMPPSSKNDAVPAVMYSAVEDMITKLGYRFVLTNARFPKSIGRRASFDLTLNWTNKRNAPMYFDRRLLVRIGTRGFETAISMKGFLPGTRTNVATIDTRGLAAGTHPVQIGLAAAGSQDPDITLAIQGTGPWYTLGDLAIGHRSSPAPPQGR